MAKNFKTISIVIPIFNEEKTILKLLDSVIKSDTLNLKKEIVLVNDGSTDGTKELLDDFSKKFRTTVINNVTNMGKGASLKKGLLKTTADVVLIQDADLEYSPKDYPNLIRPIIEGYADAVYGSRFMNANPHRIIYFYHFIANKLITALSNIFTNLNLSDIETGYKIFRGDLIRKIAVRLKAKKFGFEPEITARLAKIPGVRIYEVGISYFGRTYEEGKKISWIDGVRAVFEVIWYRISD